MNEPKGGDFIAYVDKLNREAEVRLKQQALDIKHSRLPQTEKTAVFNDDANLKKPKTTQQLQPGEVAEGVRRVLHERGKEILERAFKESVRIQLDPLKGNDTQKSDSSKDNAKVNAKNKDKDKEDDDAWAAPRDEWEARWQPVFKLVNEQRWSIAGGMIGFGIAAVALLLALGQLADPGGTVLPRILRRFDIDSIDTEVLLLIAIGAGALSYFAVARTYRALRTAGETTFSPNAFWAVVLALVAAEVIFAFSRDSIGSFFFWIIIAYGGLTGGLWRIIRWLRHEVVSELKKGTQSKGQK
jgi:hypothetical protein